MRVERTTSASVERRSIQLSYGFALQAPGLEPGVYGLEIRCFIQLSYARVFFTDNGIRTRVYGVKTRCPRPLDDTRLSCLCKRSGATGLSSDEWPTVHTRDFLGAPERSELQSQVLDCFWVYDFFTLDLSTLYLKSSDVWYWRWRGSNPRVPKLPSLFCTSLRLAFNLRTSQPRMTVATRRISSLSWLSHSPSRTCLAAACSR